MAEITFTGNLGSAPELRHTTNGSTVLGFRVADSKSKKNDQGGWDEIANQWLNVSVWGSLAELLADKLDKGTRVRVVGEFYAREYEGKNGSGISLDVKAWGVDVLSKPKQSAAPASSGSSAGGWGAPAPGGPGAAGAWTPPDPWGAPAPVPASTNGGWPASDPNDPGY